MSKRIWSLLKAVAIAFWTFQIAHPATAIAFPTFVFSTFTGDDANGMKLRIYTSADAANLLYGKWSWFIFA